MKNEKFLVTGAFGCIGAWTLKLLCSEDVPVVAFDVVEPSGRIRLLLTEEQLGELTVVQGDIRDLESLQKLAARERVTAIIHLAALQVPFCRADPSLGSQVNVTGTVNVFEVARRLEGQVRSLVYASSVAVFGPPSMYGPDPLPDSVRPAPETLYGAFKVADEMAARIYWQDWGVPSIGLRPYIVYGVGRDQGMTSDLTKAILAAALNEPFQVKFGGPVLVNYAADVAAAAVQASRSEFQGEAACNMAGTQIEVEAFLDLIRRCVPDCKVSCDKTRPLPFPSRLDDSRLRSIAPGVGTTPVERGVEETTRAFRMLAAKGRINAAALRG